MALLWPPTCVLQPLLCSLLPELVSSLRLYNLTIIHYWSIVTSLSTNGLARPVRPRASGSCSARTGDCDSGSGTWARVLSLVTRAHCSPGTRPLTSDPEGSHLCVSLLAPGNCLITPGDPGMVSDCDVSHHWPLARLPGPGRGQR